MAQGGHLGCSETSGLRGILDRNGGHFSCCGDLCAGSRYTQHAWRNLRQVAASRFKRSREIFCGDRASSKPCACTACANATHFRIDELRCRGDLRQRRRGGGRRGFHLLHNGTRRRAGGREFGKQRIGLLNASGNLGQASRNTGTAQLR
jgi:hypothetical protein